MQIIDALLITLGLDTKGFRKGQEEVQAGLKKTGEEADKRTKDMEVKAKHAAESFNQVKREVLGLLGVFMTATGLKSFVEHVTTSDAAVGRLARNLGIATSELSAWEGMAGKFGGSAQDMDSAFRNAFKIAQELKMGNTEALGPLGMLFGKAGMQNGLSELVKAAQSGDVERMMKLIQEGVTKSPDQGFAQLMMGRAGFSEQTYNVFREVNTQLEKTLQMQRALNVASERDAELAIQRQRAWKSLVDVMEHAGRVMLNSSLVSGYLQRLAGTIGGVMYYGGKAADWAANLLGGQAGNSGGATGSWGGGGASKQSYLSGLESKFGLPSGLLSAVWSQESSQGKNLLSPKGAKGDFQFRDGTAAQYGVNTGDFYSSATGAARMLRDLLQKYHGSLPEALAGYNWGQGNVDRNGMGHLPAETLAYISGVQGRMGRGNSRTDVHIGQVTINTQATDAKGIARSFADTLNDPYTFAAQANYGTQ